MKNHEKSKDAQKVIAHSAMKTELVVSEKNLLRTRSSKKMVNGLYFCLHVLTSEWMQAKIKFWKSKNCYCWKQDLKMQTK